MPPRDPYALRKTLGVSNWTPTGAGMAVIYAVVLTDHPDKVKIGRTTNPKARMKQYANWNLRNSDGIKEQYIYTLNDEYVDLPAIEAMILQNMGNHERVKAEWFICPAEIATETIESTLQSLDIPYIREIS